MNCIKGGYSKLNFEYLFINLNLRKTLLLLLDQFEKCYFSTYTDEPQGIIRAGSLIKGELKAHIHISLLYESNITLQE